MSKVSKQWDDEEYRKEQRAKIKKYKDKIDKIIYQARTQGYGWHDAREEWYESRSFDEYEKMFGRGGSAF